MSSTRSVGELAEWVGGVVEGEASLPICGVADLAGAGAGEADEGWGVGGGSECS